MCSCSCVTTWNNGNPAQFLPAHDALLGRPAPVAQPRHAAVRAGLHADANKVGLWIVDWDKRFYDALAALQGQLMPALAAEYVLYLGLMVLYMSCVNWF